MHDCTVISFFLRYLEKTVKPGDYVYLDYGEDVVTEDEEEEEEEVISQDMKKDQ